MEKVFCPKCGAEMYYEGGNWFKGWLCSANQKRSFSNRQEGHSIRVADGDLVAWWEQQRNESVLRGLDRRSREDRDDMGVLASHTGHDEK